MFPDKVSSKLLEKGLPYLKKDLDFYNVISTMNLYRSEGTKSVISLCLDDEEPNDETVLAAMNRLDDES